jgi:NOL1/NOP2/sun family putative RNA methylase
MMIGRESFAQRYALMGWKYADTEPSQALRVNTANAKESGVLERLEARGIELEKIPFLENGYWVRKAKVSVGATTEYLLGLYSIQEAAAQIPATLFTDLKDKLVLDACAAPGGKTVQLADLMRNTGMLVALDVEKGRLAALANQLERCRVQNTVVYQLDARRTSRLNLRFDCVLLDVPCSGNFATDEHWFRRRTLEDVERNAGLQREILAEAVRVLKDDGEMVYSTCSLEPEEDELNIDWAVKNLNVEPVKIDCFGENGLTRVFGKELDSSVANCRRIWPDQTQGFFVCKLRKRA